jgi:hypothetical protein
MVSQRMVLAVMLMLATGDYVRAADGCLVNGSFEADGVIDNVRVRPPSGWDVNLPPGMFTGQVVSREPTDGLYGLKLSANWLVMFWADETATVSQEVSLNSVEAIVFDLKLETTGRLGWDPNLCTAVVLIDGEVVWDSNFAPLDIRGDYPDQVCQVDDKYRDGRTHRLAFGLRMHTGGMLYEMYDSYWDGIECRLGAVEFLPADFNRDGLVDTGDLMLLADMWLREVPLNSPFNLFAGPDEDGKDTSTVNFFDLAAFGDSWRTPGPMPEP